MRGAAVMPSDEMPYLAGLLALRRRKLEAAARPEDAAAVKGMQERLHRRCAQRFRVGARRHPTRDEDCREVAADVLLRLLTAPERPLDAVGELLGVSLPVDATVEGLPEAAERVAAAYVYTMAHHRTVEVLRRMGAQLANPTSVADVLDAIEDASAEREGRSREDQGEAEFLCARLDEVAARVSESQGIKDFGATYEQLWRLAEERVTLEALQRDLDVAAATLHQRHKRARAALLKQIELDASRGLLDVAHRAPLTRVVTIFLRRRQTGAPDGVSQVEAPTKDREP